MAVFDRPVLAALVAPRAGARSLLTRSLLAFRLVRREPSASDVCAALGDAVLHAGTAPSHLISDQGSQFQSDYRAWCERHGAKSRYGAVGQHGSIAIIPRRLTISHIF